MQAQSALIVDDSATARLMLARILKSMDISTRQARSGEEALQVAANNPPAMIFLDHLMPGLDGFETLKLLKQQRATADIPVVMYTSQNAAKYVEEAKALGAIGVITKQVERGDLFELVEKMLLQRANLRSDTKAPIYDLDSADSSEAMNPEYDLDVVDIEMNHEENVSPRFDSRKFRNALVTGANDQEFARSSAHGPVLSFEQIASIEANIREAVVTELHAQDRALVKRFKWATLGLAAFAIIMLSTLLAQETHIDQLDSKIAHLEQSFSARQPAVELAQLQQLSQKVDALATEAQQVDVLEAQVGEMRLMMNEMIGILEDN
ncbi:response regulator [Allohahella marinimesophila]|uniref:Response regulatory domain-containing protein n=1 Tax=Allohahella marinimesophila TaxID=1054972 RepID=A0ABP7NQV7_9GAMM